MASYTLQKKFNLQLKNKIYQCVFYKTVDGKRKQIWKSTGETDKGKALIKAKEILREHKFFTREEMEEKLKFIAETPMSVLFPETPEQKASREKAEEERVALRKEEENKRNLSIDYIRNSYIPTRYSTKSPKTINNNRIALNRFKDIMGIDSLKNITKKDIIEFEIRLLKKYPNPKTVRDYVNKIVGILNCLYMDDLIPNDIKYVSVVRVPTSKKEVVIKDSEIDVILDAAKEENIELYKLFMLQINCGLRIDEALNTRWEWFEEINYKLFLHVQSNEEGEGIDKFETKNRKGRYILVVNDMLKFYNRYNEDSGYVTKYKNNRVIFVTIKEFMVKLFEEGKISYRYSSHDFRRYFATRLYKNGTDLGLISKLLGHSNLSTTSDYLRLTETDINISDFKW